MNASTDKFTRYLHALNRAYLQYSKCQADIHKRYSKGAVMRYYQLHKRHASILAAMWELNRKAS